MKITYRLILIPRAKKGSKDYPLYMSGLSQGILNLSGFRNW